MVSCYVNSNVLGIMVDIFRLMLLRINDPCLQISIKGMNTSLPVDISDISVLMMVMEKLIWQPRKAITKRSA